MATAMVGGSERRPEKTAAEKRHASPGRPISWRVLLGVLRTERARSTAVSAYRAAGFTADDFAHVRRARRVMADALTRTEDALEMVGPTTRREREGIRGVRRALEAEVVS